MLYNNVLQRSCFESQGGGAAACVLLDEGGCLTLVSRQEYGLMLGWKIPPGKLQHVHRRLWFPEAAQMLLNLTPATLLNV